MDGKMPEIIWYVLAISFVLSAFAGRKIRLGGALGLILFWIALFGGIAFLYGHRQQILSALGEQSNVPTSAASSQVQQNPTMGRAGMAGTVRIAQSDDGHYWATGNINGHDVRFLIDSGATITAISTDMARAAGLNIDSDGPGVMLETANGSIVARRSSAASIAVGAIRLNDLSLVVSDAFGSTNVLGMNFLSRLKSWRVENGEMVLEY